MNGNTNYAQINKGETLNAWSVAMNLVPWLEDQDELQREQSYRGKNSHSNGLPSLLLLHTLIRNNLFSIIRAGWNTKLTNLCSTLEKSAWQRERSVLCLNSCSRTALGCPQPSTSIRVPLDQSMYKSRGRTSRIFEMFCCYYYYY